LVTHLAVAGPEDLSMSPDGVNGAVEAVAQFLVADVPLGETLHRIAVLAREAIPSAMSIGVTLLDERQRPTTAVATDGLAPAVDAGQYEQGDGPCLHAYRAREIVRVDDASAVADRWPRFSQDAAAHGVRSTLGFPLLAGDEVFGALNMYACTAGAFSPEDEEAASLFVTQASVVLANARAYWAASDLASGLAVAIRNRAVIEQAKGKIMATKRCSADEAFAILVKASQRENVKLRDIARHIVDQDRARPPEPC
jgi:GAF domain-containing protein